MSRYVPYGPGAQGRDRSGGRAGDSRGSPAQGRKVRRAVGARPSDDREAWTPERARRRSVPCGRIRQGSLAGGHCRGRRFHDHELHREHHQPACGHSISRPYVGRLTQCGNRPGVAGEGASSGRSRTDRLRGSGNPVRSSGYDVQFFEMQTVSVLRAVSVRYGLFHAVLREAVRV